MDKTTEFNVIIKTNRGEMYFWSGYRYQDIQDALLEMWRKGPVDFQIIGYVNEETARGYHTAIKSALWDDMVGYTDTIQQEDEMLLDNEKYIVCYYVYDGNGGLENMVEFGLSKQEILNNIQAQKYVEGATYIPEENLLTIEDIEKALGIAKNPLDAAIIQSPLKKEPLEFVFDEEIMVSDDSQALEGYVWATDSLVDCLKAQEPPLEEDQFMENINFYPVYAPDTGKISLAGQYYLEDSHHAVGKAFTLSLTPDESNSLRDAFEAYCLKTEGKSCLSLLRDLTTEHSQEHKSLTDQIQQAEGRTSVPCSGESPTNELRKSPRE